MDGQCQDEFFHCADLGLEQERINITFRWIKQNVSSCPLFTKVCISLDTPIGRRSVGALSLLPLGSLLGSTKKLPVRFVMGFVVFIDLS